MKHTKTTKEQRIKERLIACDAIRGRVYADIEHIQTQALQEQYRDWETDRKSVV